MKEVRNNSLELRLSPESRLVEGYALVFNSEWDSVNEEIDNRKVTIAFDFA